MCEVLLVAANYTSQTPECKIFLAFPAGCEVCQANPPVDNGLRTSRASTCGHVARGAILRTSGPEKARVETTALMGLCATRAHKPDTSSVPIAATELARLARCEPNHLRARVLKPWATNPASSGGVVTVHTRSIRNRRFQIHDHATFIKFPAWAVTDTAVSRNALVVPGVAWNGDPTEAPVDTNLVSFTDTAALDQYAASYVGGGTTGWYSETGQWWQCSDRDAELDVSVRYLTIGPAGTTYGPTGPIIDVDGLRDAARAAADPGAPPVMKSTPDGVASIVQVPTWFWIEPSWWTTNTGHSDVDQWPYDRHGQRHTC